MNIPKITKVTVTAGRTFNHPTERYANFRFDLRLESEFPDGATSEDVTLLQIKAETTAERHKALLLRECELEKARESAEWNLEEARKWKGNAERWRDVEKLCNEALGKLDAWATLTPGERGDIIQCARSGYGLTSLYVSNQDEALTEDGRRELEKGIAENRDGARNSALDHETEGPVLEAKALEALNAIAKPVIFPVAEKEVHPGHPDHPETCDTDI